MTPIGSTSSNIRRAIEFIVYSSRCRPGAPCGHSRSPGRLSAAKLIAQRRLTVHLDMGDCLTATACPARRPITEREQSCLIAGYRTRAEYSPMLVAGSAVCASRKKTRAVPRGGRAAARLHRQPILWALTTTPAGTRKRSIAVQETGRCGCADGSVVTGARLDVRDLARIPAATSAPGCRSCPVRWSCARAKGRTETSRSSSSPATGGPPDPARRPRRRSPAPAHAQEHSSASRRLAQQHYNQRS
jgi:hypothetical protein